MFRLGSSVLSKRIGSRAEPIASIFPRTSVGISITALASRFRTASRAALGLSQNEPGSASLTFIEPASFLIGKSEGSKPSFR